MRPKVCNIWRDIISESVSLRYIVWLGICRMEDGDPSAVPTSSAERLTALLSQKLAWDTFAPRYRYNLEDFNDGQPIHPLNLSNGILTIPTLARIDQYRHSRSSLILESHDLSSLTKSPQHSKPEKVSWNVTCADIPSSYVSDFYIENELSIITSK